MKIIAIPCKGKDLKPGDLFSTVGEEYWNEIRLGGSIGERVYIRTEEPCPLSEMEVDIFKIEIRV